MSKVITSPVKRFAGTITLSDPLTLPQAIAVEDAIEAGKKLLKETPQGSLRKYHVAVIPGLLKCVEQIDIPNVSVDRWPGTPANASALLSAWLINEVLKLFQEDDAVPNA